MDSSDRIRRPILDRTEPIRRWSTLFAFPGVTSSLTAGTNAEHSAPMEDAVVRAVDLGYRVIDEYVNQGRKAAQRLNDRTYGPQTAGSDFQDLSARMAQYASEVTALWVDFMQRALAVTPMAITGAASPMAGRSFRIPTPQAGAVGSAPTADLGGERARVTLAIVATQPVEISLDLHAGAAGKRLLVHALRPVDGAQRRLTEVSFEPATADEPSRLRLRVPADQPAGVYSGLLIDEDTSRPVGMLSATISPPSGGSGT